MSIKGCQFARNMEDKDAIQCFQCQLAFHQDCVGISKSAFKVISSVSNIKWYCDECMKLLPDVKSLNKAVRDSNDTLNTRIDKIDESNNLLRSELEAIKSLIQRNVDGAERFDGTVLSTELCNLKNDLNKSFADAVRCEVKKNIELVNDEVKSVQKTLTNVNDMKERENNIMMFNLQETDDDKDRVKGIIKKLSSEVKDQDIKRIVRLGPKAETKIRPVLIEMRSCAIKDLVLKNSFKLKTMHEDLDKVWISHDLTVDQRAELKKLIDEAKSRKISCPGIADDAGGGSLFSCGDYDSCGCGICSGGDGCGGNVNGGGNDGGICGGGNGCGGNDSGSGNDGGICDCDDGCNGNDKNGSNDREVTKKDSELKLQLGPFNSSSADTLLDLFNSEIVRIVDMVAPCRYVKSTHTQILVKSS
ncbi:hypothetical protein HELRODRAFT_183163 [Helobdella robusta]|uniref:Zinc finger PHD-type domain-containing protein n=1 Tax=Helobdella robusta TaxID=6412 RepID=T1FJ87_HELRO|nr:hypothetical protein HELRODRAFT_183163 [Helobdella robusta]ESO11467.1 hypothetical protein HELRODRAFT_183163 [Helobdella robusta]